MKVTCQSCRASFSIQDGKIPPGKDVTVPCPRCKAPMTLKGAEKGEGLPPEELLMGGGGGGKGQDSQLEVQSQDENFELDVPAEGLQSALLCMSDEDRIDLFGKTLYSMGFQSFVASGSAAALSKMQHNHYDLIVLGDGEGEAGHLLLRHFQLLPMHLRRKFFLCYVTSKLPSQDRFAAFRAGVDMTLNVDDLQQCKVLVERAVKERATFYRVFRAELEKRGQF